MKNMQITVLAIIFVSFCLPGNAQNNDNSRAIRLKLYVNGYYSYAEGINDRAEDWVNADALFQKEKYDFGYLSFAMEIDGGKFLTHEFEIMPIKIEFNDEIYYYAQSNGEMIYVTDGSKTTTIESAIRYQANHYFLQNKLFNPYLGISTQLYYSYFNYSPVTTETWPYREQNIGLLFSCIPGVSIRLSNKLALDINVPFPVYDFRLNMIQYDNPLLPTSERKTSTFIGEFIPDYLNVRIGLVYRLNK